MLDYESAVPLYEQIVEELSENIKKGIYKDQCKLPTENELMEKYAVSRITIRRAVAELEEKGVVEKKQGKGTFIRLPQMHKPFNHPGMSFTEMCACNGVEPGAIIIEAAIVAPKSSEITEKLGIDSTQSAVHIKRVRTANGRPLVVEDNYFPIEYAFLLGINLQQDSLYRYLREEKGVQIVAGELSLRLIHADMESAALLHVRKGSSLLRTDGITYDGTGKVLHTCRQIGYGDNFDFIVR